jgi:hypothetical protein
MLTKAERAAIKQDYSQIESTFLPVDKRVPRLLTDLEETERLGEAMAKALMLMVTRAADCDCGAVKVSLGIPAIEEWRARESAEPKPAEKANG